MADLCSAERTQRGVPLRVHGLRLLLDDELRVLGRVRLNRGAVLQQEFPSSGSASLTGHAAQCGHDLLATCGEVRLQFLGAFLAELLDVSRELCFDVSERELAHRVPVACDFPIASQRVALQFFLRLDHTGLCLPFEVQVA